MICKEPSSLRPQRSFASLQGTIGSRLIKVKKRNGKTERFSLHKLVNSIHHAFHMKGISDRQLEEKIAGDVISKIGKRKAVNTEDIRKAVCASLRKEKHHAVCDYYSLVWLHASRPRIKDVIKRDGRKEKFSPEKLFRSVQKSFRHAGARDGLALQKAVQEIMAVLRKRCAGKEIHTEAIREIVEYVLMKRRLNKVARHFIMYRYV